MTLEPTGKLSRIQSLANWPPFACPLDLEVCIAMNCSRPHVALPVIYYVFFNVFVDETTNVVLANYHWQI